MRVIDLIRELPDPPVRVIDRTHGTFAIPGVDVVRDIDDRDVVVGDLIVVAIGPQGPAYSAIDEALEQVGSLPAGAHILVLTAHGAHELPVPALLEWSDRLAATVVVTAPLPYRWFRVGIVLTVHEGRTKRLQNELLLTRVALRGAASRSSELRTQLSSARRRNEALSVTDQTELITARRTASQLDEELRLQATRVAELQEELDSARAEVGQVMNSTSFQLGWALTKAARPSRDTIALGKRLMRLWGNRGAWRDGVSADPPKAPRADRQDPDARLLHVFRQFGPIEGRPVVAGIFARQTLSGIDRSTLTVPLWPNDAHAVLNRIEPVAIVVESKATSPGEIWHGLGQASGGSLERELGVLFASARRRHIPIVFWWNSPASHAPGLRKLAAPCDAIAADPTVDGVPPTIHLQSGVPLGALLPRPPTADAIGRPLLHTTVDRPPVGPVEQSVRDAARERGLEIRFDPDHRVARTAILDPDDRLARYAATPWAIAAPFGTPSADWTSMQTLTMATSGVTIVGGRGALPPSLGDHLIEVVSSADAQEAVAMAESRKWTAQQCRNALQECWRSGRWESALAGVLDGIGANTSTLSSVGACAVTARPVNRDQIDKLATDVLRQNMKPSHVIVEGDTNSGIEWLASELGRQEIAVSTSANGHAEFIVAWTADAFWSSQHLAVLAASHRLVGATVAEPDGRWLIRDHRAPAGDGVTPWWIERGGWL